MKPSFPRRDPAAEGIASARCDAAILEGSEPRMDATDTPAYATIRAQLQCLDNETLAAIAHGKLDVQALAQKLLANRGCNTDGAWTGKYNNGEIW